MAWPLPGISLDHDRRPFEEPTTINPNKRIKLETLSERCRTRTKALGKFTRIFTPALPFRVIHPAKSPGHGAPRLVVRLNRCRNFRRGDLWSHFTSLPSLLGNVVVVERAEVGAAHEPEPSPSPGGRAAERRPPARDHLRKAVEDKRPVELASGAFAVAKSRNETGFGHPTRDLRANPILGGNS